MRQDFLIDADDTLWENNVYYERVIDRFLEAFGDSGRSRAEMRHVLNEIERSNIPRYGYGVVSFGHSLVEACHRLSSSPPTPELLQWAGGLTAGLARHDIELLDGVRETLEYLADRHRLLLMTKGQPEEQTDKLERSGLKPFFSALEIVREKNPAVYREVLKRHRLEASRTWMVGNSPRSDINPALEAGLNAIFIPHDNTWMLEHDELASGPGRLHILERFSLLRDHF